MTYRTSLLIIGLLTPAVFVCAQNKQNPYPTLNPTGTAFTPPAGNIVLDPHSYEPVTSLDLLIRMSAVIVDGSVTTALPPINENPADPGAVETGSLVTVNNVLFGSAPNASQILLLERGGKQGSWLISTAGDPLVQPGERYILFLHPDARKSIPNSVGIIPDSSVVPRYEVVGYANGKARIDANQKIQFPSGAIPSLLQYNNGDLNTFTAGLKGKIGSMFPTPLPYPSGVTPLSAPPHTIFPSVPSSSKP